MSGRRAAATLLVAALSVAAWMLPASATVAPQITARAGHYTGQEADQPSPLPVSFRVSANHKRVLSFSAEAEAKAGCKNHLTGFQAPTAPMPIGKAGRFARSSTNYPQPGVRVTVTGRFTTPSKVSGHITIRFTRVKGCNASRAFTAKRTT